MFIPAFGNGPDSSGTVSLFGLTGISPWVKIVFIVIISVAILNGICGVVIANFNKPVWNRHRLVVGVGLSILAVKVFIATRQPYAGIFCFSFLVIKGFLIAKDIEPLSRKWWKYWRNYWRLRGTKDALLKDWACEVTIPVNTNDPKGNW